jgi:ethanolamine utilization protein EutA
VAIAIKDLPVPSFRKIDELATAIVRKHETGKPLVVVCENDVAKALGQAIQTKSVEPIALICIDSICVSDGDTIDIGKPVGDWDVLPVVVKTLIFG